MWIYQSVYTDSGSEGPYSVSTDESSAEDEDVPFHGSVSLPSVA